MGAEPILTKKNNHNPKKKTTMQKKNYFNLDVKIFYINLTHYLFLYPWLTPQFYYDMLQTYLIREFNSLEWGLISPPKAQPFVNANLLESRFSFNFKHAVMNLTLSKIAAGLASVAFFALARYMIHNGGMLDPLDLKEALTLGTLALYLRLILEGATRGHLETMGVNYNVKQLLYGLDKPENLVLYAKEANESQGGPVSSAHLLPGPGTYEVPSSPITRPNSPSTSGSTPAVEPDSKMVPDSDLPAQPGPVQQESSQPGPVQQGQGQGRSRPGPGQGTDHITLSPANLTDAELDSMYGPPNKTNLSNARDKIVQQLATLEQLKMQNNKKSIYALDFPDSARLNQTDREAIARQLLGMRSKYNMRFVKAMSDSKIMIPSKDGLHNVAVRASPATLEDINSGLDP